MVDEATQAWKVLVAAASDDVRADVHLALPQPEWIVDDVPAADLGRRVRERPPAAVVLELPADPRAADATLAAARDASTCATVFVVEPVASGRPQRARPANGLRWFARAPADPYFRPRFRRAVRLALVIRDLAR